MDMDSIQPGTDVARQPRHPTARLPISSAAAEEAYIASEIKKYVPAYWEWIGSKTGQDMFAAEVLWQLQVGTMDPARVIELARHGHPFADKAARAFIDKAMDEGRYEQLPMCMREYGRECVRYSGRTSLPPEYPSTAWRGIDDFRRNFLIVTLVNRVVCFWPSVPKTSYKRGRRSAADIVGECLGLSETQVRRIIKDRSSHAETFLRFLRDYRLASPPL
jgi:hypothetical protein